MNHWSRNPVLWLVLGLPAAAVAASFATLVIAARGSDPPLPSGYHWEGAALDADEARLAAARRQGITAEFHYDSAAQRCVVALRGAAPTQLRLQLTHATRATDDQQRELQREGALYTGACRTPPSSHWWVEITDDAASWSLRGRLQGDLRQPGAIDNSSAAAP